MPQEGPMRVTKLRPHITHAGWQARAREIEGSARPQQFNACRPKLVKDVVEWREPERGPSGVQTGQARIEHLYRGLRNLTVHSAILFIPCRRQAWPERRDAGQR